MPQPLLIPDGLFACPRCGSSAVIPSAHLVSAGMLRNPLSGFCNRCEHRYQLTVGSPSTTTTGSANTQGVTTLTVVSGTGFTLGTWVVVDSSSVDGGAEVVQATGAGTSTTIPVTPVTLPAHAAGATVQAATLGPLGSMT